VLDSLGLAKEPIPNAAWAGERYPSTAPGGATSIPGLVLAGNVTEPMAQVVAAAGQGLMAGALVNADLVAQDAALAVQRTTVATAAGAR
jgi:thioredoxin reductase